MPVHANASLISQVTLSVWLVLPPRVKIEIDSVLWSLLHSAINSRRQHAYQRVLLVSRREESLENGPLLPDATIFPETPPIMSSYFQHRRDW